MRVTLILAIFSLFPCEIYPLDLSKIGESCFQTDHLITDEIPETFEEDLPEVSIGLNNKPEAPNSLAEYDGEPSSIAAGCVNVINGSFIARANDLSIPGPEALTFSRSYSSSCGLGEGPFSSWMHNQHGTISLSKKEVKHKFWEPSPDDLYYAAWSGPSGLSLTFSGPAGSRRDVSMNVFPSEYRKGLTNLGPTSGQNNIQNMQLVYARKSLQNHCFLKKGDGTICAFKKFKTGEPFKLIQETFPNGNLFKFTYDKELRISQTDLENSSGGCLSSIKLAYSPQKDCVTATSSTGKRCEYRFDLHKYNKKLYFALRDFTGPGGYFEKYQYSNDKDISSRRLIEKRHPEGRFLSIDYHKQRVARLKAPLGAGPNPITCYKFIYETHKHSGTTHVYDIGSIKTTYKHDNYRLNKIIRYDRNNEPYSFDELFWEDNVCTNLSMRLVLDGNQFPLLLKKYTYDNSGNIIQETVCGNLTGREIKLPPININVIQSLNLEKWIARSDKDAKHYEYSQDGKNLLIKEKDARKITTYSYYKGTNLLAAKLIYDCGQIKIRQFFRYDHNNVMIAEIVDDGSTDDIENLEGVTERRIKNIIPTSCGIYGLPEEIFEYYLDLNSNQRILLKHIKNRYSADGYLIQQEHHDANDIYSHTLFWEYNDQGKIISETDAIGRKIERRYDLNGNLTYEQTYTSDNAQSHFYDYSNRLIKTIAHTSEGDLVSTFTYDLKGQRTSSTDHFGNTTKYLYDEFGRIMETQLPQVSDQHNNLIIPASYAQYNTLGHPVELTDTLGNITSSKFNLRGQVYEIIHSDGSTQRRKYSCDGLLLWKEDKNFAQTFYEYDFQGRPICEEIRSPKGETLAKRTSVYNAFHLLSETTLDGATTYYTYDFSGRTIKIAKGPSQTLYFYDSLSRCERTQKYADDNHFIAECKQYDLLDRIVKEWLQDESKTIYSATEYTYDIYGNKIQITLHNDEGPSSTTTSYNSLGQPKKIIDPSGNETHYVYHYHHRNEQGQKVLSIEQIFPNGCKLFTIQDPLGKVKSVIRKDPLGEELQKYEHYYDLAGNLCKKVETVFALGSSERTVTTKWDYDSMNRIIALYEAFGEPEQRETHYTYNPMGKIETLIKPDGTQIFHAYDFLLNAKTIKSSDGTIHYEYTFNNKSLPISVHDLIHNQKTTREYDLAGNLVAESLSNNLKMEYTYDNLSRILHCTYPDGTAANYIYQGPQLSQIQRSSTTPYNHTYQYSASGKLKSESLLGQAGIINYTYDQAGRFASITHSAWKEQFSPESYDSVGNLLSSTIDDAEGTYHPGYKYDGLNQLSEESGIANHSYIHDSLYNRRSQNNQSSTINSLNQLTSTPQCTLTYDQNGNVTNKATPHQTLRYQYDALDRLTSVSSSSKMVKYLYDEKDRRVQKQFYLLASTTPNSWELTHTERFIYQGSNEIGLVNDSNLIMQLRILGVGLGGEIGAAISFEFDNTPYAPIYDHNGNVVTLLDAAGEVSASYRYSAFGIEHPSPQPTQVTNPWRYMSKREDAESGWVHFGHRYYDPQLGRWMTMDPMGYSSESPNLYAYLLNSPLTRIDPYGLTSQETQSSITNSLCHIAQGAYNFATGLIQGLGTTLHTLSYHLLPPILKEPLCLLGQLLSTGTLSNYVFGWSEMHSFAYCFSKEAAYAYTTPHAVILVCGVLTDFKTMLEYAREVSKAHGGIEIFLVYNASHGASVDIGEVLTQKFGIPTKSVDSLREAIKMAEGKYGPDVSKTIYAFSQGGEIVHGATKYMSLRQMQRTNVVTFGSARMIPHGYFASAVNYINKSDFIPFIADIVGIIRGLITNDTNICFLPATDLPFCGHKFQSTSYQKIINAWGDDLKDAYLPIPK